MGEHLMPVTIGIARSRFLLTDNDGDGQPDPGDVFQHTIIITNSGNISATNVVDAETENGLTIDAASVKIGPIAFDDAFNITGNTPITFTAAQLLGNDQDPDGPEASLVITSVSAGANGTIVDNGNGTYTFTPTTGLDIGQTATFTYTIQDAQGLSSVAATPGTVTLTVTDVVWYVDKNAAAGGNGTFLNPFQSLTELNGVTGDGTTNDDVDSINETIFIYDRSGSDAPAGIVLENGQKLFGDGHAFVVNGITIGASTSNSTIDHSGVGITLGSGNTIDGIDLNGTLPAAVGIQDGGATVGALTITNTSISGSGQIIDIDQGGTLAVTLTSASSNGSTGANGGVIDLTGVTGSFTVTGALTINGTQGQTGIDISGNNDLAVSFQGLTTVNSAANDAVSLSANTGTSTMGFTGGLDIDTTSGMGLSANAGGPLTITGAGNTIDTTTGQILSITNNSLGASGVAFSTLAASGTVTNTAISLNNVDNNSLSVGTVTIAGTSGATSDGINVSGGSSANVTVTTATINNTGGDGIELNGNSGSFTLNGGNIGNTDDPAGDTVNVTGGTGAVSIAANLFKSSAGNIVEVSNHATGAVTFSGNLSATGGTSNGILLSGNTSGTIAFTGASKVLNTGANTAITFSNTNATGATVNFQNGGLDIDTTTGTGINATSTTVGAGSLSITGTGNSATATTGRPVILDGVSSGGITFQSVAASGGSNTAIFLKNAGTGGFTVTGTNSDAGSGGTLNFAAGGADGSTTQGVGVYLENVGNVSLSNMTFTGTFSNYGIRGESVNNFTLRDSSLSAGATFGSSAAEGVMRFGTQGSTTGLTGTALFEGNVIGNGSGDNVSIYMYGANSLNLTFRDTAGGDAAVMNANNSTTGNDNLIVETGGTSNLTMSVTGVDFNGARGDQLQVIAAGSTTQSISVTSNTFDQSIVGALGGGVKFGGGGLNNYNVNYTFSNNTMTGSTVSAFDGLYNGLNGTITGVISGNTIGTAGSGYQNALGQTGSLQAFGIFAGIDKTVGGTVTYALRIENNTIRDTADAGIVLRSNNGGNTGTARLEATITNNTVAEIKPTTSLGAMYLQIGGNSASGTDNALMGLNLTGNTLTATVNNAIIFDEVSSAARFYLPGYGGSPNGEFANAFFPPAANGTASSGINTYLAGKGNVLTNGTGPSEPGGVNAENVVGVTGASFVLAVPLLAAPTPGEDWETALQARLSANTPTPQPDPATADPGSGDSTINPVCDNGPTTSGKGAAAPADDGILSQAELDLLVQAAIQRWADAGATPEQLAAMRATSIGVADMTGLFLGTSTAGQILVDSDGAGHGWFLDATPSEDSEFEGSGSRLTADAGGPAEGRMDLLTVLMHELGHQVGLEDLYLDGESSELMYGYALMGERRLPQADDLAAADPNAMPHGSFLLSPITIGVLPANHAVQVTYTSTVNSFSNQVIANPFNNTSTVTFTEAGSPVTSSPEALVVDSLTLGNLVFIDANNNGVFDGGDTGVNGVTISLFADADNNNVADGAAIATTTTAGGGLYSFGNLAPGNYIVSIDAANFTGGGALVSRSSATGSADPDDNVDNDDNGAAGPAGTVVSQSITLSYNNEPTPGTGNDTNNTLDFGFVTPNQAPVNTVPGAQSVNEDANLTFSSGGGNAISVADADAGSGLLTVTLSVSHGTLTLGGFVGLSFSNGDGNADATFTFSGTITNINNALAGLTYTPTLNYNGADTLAIITNDNGNTGADPGLTDGPSAEQDSDNIAITVNPVNDPPSGADDSATIVVSGSYVFSAGDFNFTDPVEGNNFSAVIVASLATNGGLFFDADGPGGAAPTAVVIGQVINAADLAAGKFTFQADAGESGTPYATLTFRVRDDGGTANGGNDTDPTPNTFTFNVTNDAPPVIDLNGGAAGIDSAVSYNENAAPTLLASGAVVTDADNANLTGATITIATGFQSGDILTVNGATSGTVTGITFNYNGGTGVLTLSGTATLAEYQALAQQVGFESTSDTPGTSRQIMWTVNDGVVNSAAAMTAVTVTAVDDPAVAKNDAFTTDEATTIGAGLSLFNNNGSGADSDVDGPALTISAVNGSGAAVGTQIALASGALLTVNANGTFSYNPNGAFNTTPTPASGASNQPQFDSFTYTLAGGSTATATLTVDGLDTNDILLGTPGNDVLSGGIGNDSYVVENTGDVVNENSGAGLDIVYTSVNYQIGANVERLGVNGFTTTFAVNVTGNGLDNELRGNDGANNLDGMAGADNMMGFGGDDNYVVDNIQDVVIETAGGGFDTVYTAIDYTLSDHFERLGVNGFTTNFAINLTGNSLDNEIIGNDGVNIINGGGGADLLKGLGGNDVYVIDNAGDVVQELAGGGFDTVYTSVDYVLGANVERAGVNGFTTTFAVNLTGNDLANELIGNDGANVLDGGLGADILFGRGGADSFNFTTALGGGNVDQILAFQVGSDRVGLDDAIFTALSAGALAPGAFRTGSAALDADDRIIYDSTTGALYYDADGVGGAAAVQFATLSSGLGLGSTDFVVI
jgi:hypothetical protein